MAATVSCDPNDLLAAAKCFSCLDGMHAQVQTYLLAVIAGASLDPNVLLANAKAFQQLQGASLMEVQNYLLCQIANL